MVTTFSPQMTPITDREEGCFVVRAIRGHYHIIVVYRAILIKTCTFHKD